MTPDTGVQVLDFVLTVNGGADSGQHGQAQMRTGPIEVHSQWQLSASGAAELVRAMHGAVHGTEGPSTNWQSIAEQVGVFCHCFC